MQKSPDFRFKRTRKSGKTDFCEVHIKRDVITHLITVLFAKFGVCRKVLTGFIQIEVHWRAILKRPFKRADSDCSYILSLILSHLLGVFFNTDLALV